MRYSELVEPELCCKVEGNLLARFLSGSMIASLDVRGQPKQLKLTILATRNLEAISNCIILDDLRTHVSTTAAPLTGSLGTDLI